MIWEKCMIFKVIYYHFHVLWRHLRRRMISEIFQQVRCVIWAYSTTFRKTTYMVRSLVVPPFSFENVLDSELQSIEQTTYMNIVLYVRYAEWLYTLHCTEGLYTLHCTEGLYTLHCTEGLYTLHCTLYRRVVHTTLYRRVVHTTLYTLHSCTLYIVPVLSSLFWWW